jgi:hypothetical protein
MMGDPTLLPNNQKNVMLAYQYSISMWEGYQNMRLPPENINPSSNYQLLLLGVFSLVIILLAFVNTTFDTK